MSGIHAFYCGEMFDAYEYFGAHVEHKENGVCTVFRVYAPNARRVEVIGSFNGWKPGAAPMEQDGQSGIFIWQFPASLDGAVYKYRILTGGGEWIEKTDPFASAMELRPASAAVVKELSYEFRDGDWMKCREKNYERPMNIYEVHLGSWKKPESPDGAEWYTYREIAPQLVKYVKENGYTHIELLPLNEHPADCSWGYQVTGFFAPTSRYGTPEEFMEFVDICHQSGVGVIMDFVPGHFAIDGYGLGRFDGTALYEYPDTETGYSEWGSYSFNYYRGEVCSFLQSAADCWLGRYHVDGIRMDAVSNVIYWKGSPERGVNEGGITFLKRMNEGLHRRYPSAMLIAEDSSAYLKVTAPTLYDGLGFDYKWDMGWMNDTLEYFKIPPYARKHHYHKLTFSMHYFYNELYLLSLSHDEDVHGKATIIQKMWGDYEDKFRQVKTLYAYMYTHPGKKLDFMGNELGHFREWDENRELDWGLLKYPAHDSFSKYRQELHRLYAGTPALYQKEYDSRYFRWIEADAWEECIYAYERIGEKESWLIVMNTENVTYAECRIGYDREGSASCLMRTDSQRYGGSVKEKKEVQKIRKEAWKKWDYCFKTDLRPFETKIFKIEKKT